MFLNNINFPNRILDAIREDKLVVFAGAGASMEKPTSLPNFQDLAKEIAEGTGQTLGKNEPCEVFLGALKARKIDVNESAASILSGTCLKHNALHEAIVDLFVSPERIKIVTTNYDQMFEQVLEERGVQAPIYNSPALPLGSDVNGIIHIHGNVSNPKYMVVTDEDFGRAYLTEGYATRFLVKLFESYTVLFIGYSYSDTILRYLTRAMSRQHSANRYILTDDTKSDWNALGISSINYPKRSYAVMRGGLIKLGNHAKKGLWDWKNQFTDITDAPPKDLTIETEIDYCLETIERSRVLADCIRGAEWLELLDKKDVFSCCFSESMQMGEDGRLWANWLCNKIVGKNDDSLKMLFVKHGNQFSSMFSKLLLNRITRDLTNISDECFTEYITLMDRHLDDPWLIEQSIEKAYARNLIHLCLHLFGKLFTCSIQMEKSIWMQGRQIEFVHKFLGQYDLVNQAWDLIHEKVISLYADEVISFVQRTIEDLHYQYAEMGYASYKNEPWSMVMLVVEDRVQEYNRDPIHVLIRAYLQANIQIGEKDKSKHYLMRGVTSDSILMRKIALRAIRESACFTYDEMIGLLCEKELIWFTSGKEQVFLLAKESFSGASFEAQNRFLDVIEKGPGDYEEETSRQYEIYNWCVWLQRTAPENDRIAAIIQQILSKYTFAPREHPELIILETDVVGATDKSPVTTQRMLEMPIEKLIELLVDYKSDSFEGSTRWGLLSTFSNCVKENTQWAKRVLASLYTSKIENVEIWNYMFRGFEETDLPIDESLLLLEELSKVTDILSDVLGVARYLLKVLQSKEVQSKFKEHEQMIFELSVKLWNRRPKESSVSSQLIMTVHNTTTGIILMCWIYMTSYSDNTNIPDSYKARFEEALQLNSWEREVANCILAGHFNFFCYRDSDWCISRFKPMLTGKNKKAYLAAWEGVVYFSRTIHKDTVDIIAPIYLKAVKNINWLEGEVGHGFIDLYLTLLIFAVDKPTKQFIPEFYKSSSEENRKRFVSSIGYRLRNMDTETKLSWWNSWLKRFIENRKSNKPVELTESECRSLFMLIPRLDFVLDDAINTLCKGRMPSSIDYLLWYELREKHLALSHPHSIAKLLIALLNSISSLEIWGEYIIEIVRSLQGLDKKEKKQLQEVLLKHSITISLDENDSGHNLIA